MPGLTIIVASADGERFHSALSLAAANAAMGERTRIFFQGEAVELLKFQPTVSDNRRLDVGIPTLKDLFAEAAQMGVAFIACHSGLLLANLTANDLPAQIDTGGLVQLLSNLDDDRLIIA